MGLCDMIKTIGQAMGDMAQGEVNHGIREMERQSKEPVNDLGPVLRNCNREVGSDE